MKKICGFKAVVRSFSVRCLIVMSCIIASTASSLAQQEVEPEIAAVSALSEQAIILDVRAPFERKARLWRPMGIVIHSLPYGRSQWQGAIDIEEQRDFLEGFMALHLSGKEILIVCERGARSYSAARLLGRHGFKTRSITSGLWGDSESGGFAQILADEIEFGLERAQADQKSQ